MIPIPRLSLILTIFGLLLASRLKPKERMKAALSDPGTQFQWTPLLKTVKSGDLRPQLPPTLRELTLTRMSDEIEEIEVHDGPLKELKRISLRLPYFPSTSSSLLFLVAPSLLCHIASRQAVSLIWRLFTDMRFLFSS